MKKSNKLSLSRATIKRLTSDDAYDIAGGACCQSAACDGSKADCSKGWTLSVSVGPSKGPVPGVSISVSYSFTGR